MVGGSIPANTTHSPNGGTIMAYHLRRWDTIVPAMNERLFFAEMEERVSIIVHLA